MNVTMLDAVSEFLTFILVFLHNSFSFVQLDLLSITLSYGSLIHSSASSSLPFTPSGVSYFVH